MIRDELITRRQLLAVGATMLAATTLVSAVETNPPDISVDFADCVESIGVGLVPTDRAEALVPPGFILVGSGAPVTPLVVRTSDCAGIAVDGDRAKAGSVVQIGLVIVPPDSTGDINNYTLFYYASDAKLAYGLRRLGVDAQYVPTITYDYDATEPELAVRVPRPGRPTLSIAGTVEASSTIAGSFHANWWQQTAAGRVKMATEVPALTIGSADLVLTTHPGNALGELLGGGSFTFPVLQQFNTFETAQMNVTVAPE